MLAESFRRMAAEFIYPEARVERRSMERQLNYDSMTGLANRRAFDLAVSSAEADSNIWFVVFDLNNFGKVNKIEGHEAGDKLKKFAANVILSSSISVVPSYRCFLIGGDEFVILCEPRYCEWLIDSIEGIFGETTISDGTVISITGSYGPTFAEADSRLQELKARRKRSQRITG